MFQKIHIRITLQFLILLLGLLVLVCKPTKNSFPRVGVGGDFRLSHKDGIFDLSQNRGKVFLLFFGYTHCPDICPMTMTKITGAKNILTASKPDFGFPQILFVSVDYKKDTANSVAEYIHYFDKDALGMTGTKEEIDAVVSTFKASYTFVSTNSKMQETIDHSTYIYLIDKDGVVRYLFRQADTKESIATVIQTFSDASSGK